MREPWGAYDVDDGRGELWRALFGNKLGSQEAQCGINKSVWSPYTVALVEADVADDRRGSQGLEDQWARYMHWSRESLTSACP